MVQPNGGKAIRPSLLSNNNAQKQIEHSLAVSPAWVGKPQFPLNRKLYCFVFHPFSNDLGSTRRPRSASLISDSHERHAFGWQSSAQHSRHAHFVIQWCSKPLARHSVAVSCFRNRWLRTARNCSVGEG